MLIVLARHGNTFDSTDKVVWVGGQNDLALVEHGRNQAQTLAGELKSRGIVLAGIYCAPLKRTKEYAEIIGSTLGLSGQIVTDVRLIEIDYGNWNGLSDAEIISKFGQAELDQWMKRSIWPKTAQWSESEAEIISRVHDFSKELIDKHARTDRVLVVSSNGVLRYFLTLIPGEYEQRRDFGAVKVKTGNVCLVQTKPNMAIVAWNQAPNELALRAS